MEFSELSNEDQDFFEEMYKLDELADEAGGYVQECYDFPSFDIKAVNAEMEKLGRNLTAKEFEQFKIK